MSIELTEVAAHHVRQYADKRKKAFVGLRLAVRPSGCSGLAYILEYAEAIQNGDLTFESNGIKIITDPKSHVHIDGTVLDYVRDGVQEGFRFNNPNVKNACGCGESFNT
ncbi:MAG: iron-sulfur cluster assembly accessory protein [Proteobacteria bacterium]|nr:iron-sulfur cluster assembly accessory protein [Pseudomonadota bacterium]MCH9758528.1 iron-sulfur cluster assembly accessory protein [Pseudomonadota bacterium]